MGQIFFIVMRTPPSIKPGDKIGIAATARKITSQEIEYAVKVIEDRGLVLVLADNLFLSDHQYAGSDSQRAAGFQKLLDDPEIMAVLSVRGGYGSVRVVDKIDFSKFKENPKWLAGYSDFTVFLNHVPENYGVETLHATMPVNFRENTEDALNGLFEVLSGKRPEYRWVSGKLYKKGTAGGALIGGNLSVLYSMLGSSSFPETEGNVLFLEDLDEYLYHIDRMMQALKRAGKLEGLSGLVIGAMTDMNDNTVAFGKTAGEIIFESVEEYGYPVVMNFSAGHINNNLPLIIGGKTVLEVSDDQAVLKFG